MFDQLNAAGDHKRLLSQIAIIPNFFLPVYKPPTAFHVKVGLIEWRMNLGFTCVILMYINM